MPSCSPLSNLRETMAQGAAAEVDAEPLLRDDGTLQMLGAGQGAALPLLGAAKTAAPTRRGASSSLDPLAGARGLCALAVVVGHFLTFWAPNGADGASVYPVFGLEYLSPVTLFFVISGYTLTLLYDRGDAPLSTWMDVRTFLRRRVARLVPVYYLGLLLDLAPLLVYADTGSLAAAIPVTLLQSLTVVVGIWWAWDGPLWTVSAFVFCYLAFPLLLRLLRKASNTALVWVFIALGVGSAALGVGWVLRVDAPFILHALAPFRLIHFAIGVVAGLWAKRGTYTPGQSRWSPTLVAELCTSVQVLNLVACAIVVGLKPTSNADGTNPRANFYFAWMYGAEYAMPCTHCGSWRSRHPPALAPAERSSPCARFAGLVTSLTRCTVSIGQFWSGARGQSPPRASQPTQCLAGRCWGSLAQAGSSFPRGPLFRCLSSASPLPPSRIACWRHPHASPSAATAAYAAAQKWLQTLQALLA